MAKNQDRLKKPLILPNSFIQNLPKNIRPSALSVDVINLCNLRCKHCFWDSYDDNIQDKINLNILDSVKEALHQFPSITNITWYGGEPLINETSRKIVQNGTELNVKNNLLITNGTFPMPFFGEKTHYAVSLDGTATINDAIRGKGVYQQAKNNIRIAISKGIPVGLIFCINEQNIGCIEEFLAEWYETGIDGVTFTCYAPIKTKSSQLTISPRQRENAVAILQRMKTKYGDFVYNTNLMIELIREKYSEELAVNCPMDIRNKNARIFSVHMCNDGSIRIPCALGSDADCLQCRSITKLALYAGMIKKDRETIRALFGMYHSKTHHHQNKPILN